MNLELIRTVRTPHSERFLLRRAGADAGALDIHYLADRHVNATLIIFEGAGIREEEIPGVVTYLDEALLPDASLDDRRLTFAVVVGRVHGAFESEPGTS